MELASMATWYLPLQRGAGICSRCKQEHPNQPHVFPEAKSFGDGLPGHVLNKQT